MLLSLSVFVKVKLCNLLNFLKLKSKLTRWFIAIINENLNWHNEGGGGRGGEFVCCSTFPMTVFLESHLILERIHRRNGAGLL